MFSYVLWLKKASMGVLLFSQAFVMSPELSLMHHAPYSHKLMNRADKLLKRKYARFNPDRTYPFHCYDRLTYLVTHKLLPQLCAERRFEQADTYIYQLLTTLVAQQAYEDVAVITVEAIKSFSHHHYSPLKTAKWVRNVIALIRASFEKSVLAEPMARAIEAIMIAWLEANVFYEGVEYASQITQLLISHEISPYFPSRLINVLVKKLRKEGLINEAVDMCKKIIEAELSQYASWSFVLSCENFELFKQAWGSAAACDYFMKMMQPFLARPATFWKEEGEHWYFHKKRFYSELMHEYETEGKQLAHPEVLNESRTYQKILREWDAIGDQTQYNERMTKRLLGRAMSVVMVIVHEMMKQERHEDAQRYYAQAYDKFHAANPRQAEAMKQFIGQTAFTSEELSAIKEFCLVWPPPEAL